jgi:hypothetical protein
MAWSDKVKSGSGVQEGTITGYSFTEGFPFGDKQTDDETIYMVLDVTPDGADEPVRKALYLGSGRYLAIEEDGQVLRAATNVDGEKEVDDSGVPRLYEKGDVYQFLTSLEDAGFPAESRFPDPIETHAIDLRGMIGTRVRIVQEPVIDTKTGKPYKRVAKQGQHKGREFNVTTPRVSKVLGLPDERAKTGAKMTNGTGKGKRAGNLLEDDLDDRADAFLVAMLQATKGRSMPRSALTLAVTRKAAKDGLSGEEREALRRRIFSEDYLVQASERGIIAFDAGGQQQEVTLA